MPRTSGRAWRACASPGKPDSSHGQPGGHGELPRALRVFGIVQPMLGVRPRRVRHLVVVLALLVAVPVVPGLGQVPPQGSGAAVPFTVLAEQVLAFFPVIQTEVVEVSGDRVTLASGRSEGVQPGVELTAFREGRELYHPTTKRLLGRTEE